MTGWVAAWAWLALAAIDPACPELNLGFSLENVQSDVPFDGIVGGEGAAGTVELEVPLGTQGETHVFANVISDIDDPGSTGVQGWSLSVEITGDLDVAEVTVEGTAGGTDTMFELSEVVDPAKSGGRRGVTSAVVRIHLGGYLPLVGTRSVLDMTVASLRPQGRDVLEGTLRFADGLVGSGRPVVNEVVENGASHAACNGTTASLTLAFGRSMSCFIRGDSNEDGKVDLADAIWTLNELFLSGEPTQNRDAADSDDDGRVIVGDAIYTIRHALLGGPPPPPPFPECGQEPQP